MNEVITVRLFKRKEKRAADGAVGIEDCLLSAMLGGNIEVTKAEALQIPTVAACVNLIADRISALPIKLYRENGKEVEEITDDKRLCLLNHDTGDTINASEMKKLWVRDYFLGKGSYTYIERNMYNEPTGLYYVDETRVAIAPNADPIHKTFAINVNGHVYFPYQFLKILRNSKGFGVGTSIIAEDPLALAIFYNTMKFENATIRKGGNKKGYILSKNKLSQDALDKVKEAWRKLYSNSYDTKDNAVVLNDGLDFKESSSTSVELQLNENKRTNAEEICKLFCMPADVLNGKANEAMTSQFVQNCLMPLINTIESALDRDMLTEAEKIGHYYWAFDTSELTRGDFASRMNAYAVALQNNIYQLDEIREMEDKPPLGFNFIKLGLDAVLVDPKTGDIYTPNTGKLERISSEKGLTFDDVRAILEARGRHWIKGEHGYFAGSVSDGGSGGGASSGHSSKHNIAEDLVMYSNGGSSGGGTTDGMLTKDEESILEENRELLKEKTSSGELPLKINQEKQLRHVLPEGATKMPDGRSYVTIGMEECQGVVDRYNCTGDVTHIVASHKFKELIETDTIIGVDGYSNQETNQAFINYSKTGTHIVPTKKGRGGE